MQNPNWHNIWIIGAGSFGQLAARRICTAQPQCAVTLVDPEPVQSIDECHTRIRQVQTDGIRFLVEKLDTTNQPDWIVPAAPVHVAYEYIRGKLSSHFSFEPAAFLPSAVKHLPNPQPGDTGTLYVSNATWICPDDCPEPADHCTVTEEAHPCFVYRVLQEISSESIESIAIRSHQLLPGVGGYAPRALFDALDRVRTSTNTVLLSTACRCHGVLNAFRLKPLTC